MKSIRIKKKIDQTIIKRKLHKDEQINVIEYNIVNSNEIHGLIPLRVHSGLMGNRFQFVVRNCIDLPSYLSSGIRMQDFLSIVLDIVKTIESCESYGIRTSNLELSPRYVFYDYTKREIKLLYWPVISMYAQSDLRAFFQSLGECFHCPEEEIPFREGYLAYFDNRIKFDIYHFERILTAWVSRWRTRDGQQLNNRPIDSLFDDRTLKGNDGGALPDCRAGSRRLHLLHVRTNRKIEVDKTPFTIGRRRELCDYAVEDNAAVSKRHLMIKQSNGGVFLYDDYSLNHVCVNGVEIPQGTDYEVFEQCTIDMGSEQFVLFFQ